MQCIQTPAWVFRCVFTNTCTLGKFFPLKSKQFLQFMPWKREKKLCLLLNYTCMCKLGFKKYNTHVHLTSRLKCLLPMSLIIHVRSKLCFLQLIWDHIYHHRSSCICCHIIAGKSPLSDLVNKWSCLILALRMSD